jgi:hypothetical protein
MKEIDLWPYYNVVKSQEITDIGRQYIKMLTNSIYGQGYTIIETVSMRRIKK